MRYLPIIMMLGIAVTGCSSMQPSKPIKFDLFGLIRETPKVENTAPENKSTLKTIDYANTDLDKNQYRLDAFSLGAWVNQKQGDVFKEVKPSSPDAAIVYLYRIDSRWNRQEILAPNFFLNDRRIPSLLNNHYYWIELPAGVYRLNVSHPLAILHFQEGSAADFEVKGGQTYFLRYEEQAFRGKPDKSLGLLQSKYLMQMPTDKGLEEIRSTQLKSPGLSFVDRRGQPEQASLPVFNEQKQRNVKSSHLEAVENPQTTKPFKLWNPLTW